MRQVLMSVALLLGPLGSAANVWGEEPRPEIPPDLILERFSVSKNGDALLVPVRVAERDYQFIIDTGASMTLFDRVQSRRCQGFQPFSRGSRP